ncbi:MAG: LysM peptidoglycan-binding domain-containing protein [Paludibacteraceae bacterium]|nr:LysM peptidoglycan-binding domain-containing protein [Paludibacteraceae bacterium]MBR5972611.1 LysM peptidoglycan-binding domain-containing protein [Paludibacteraceae bacterium]
MSALKKLEIISYTDCKFSTEQGRFSMLVNPVEYSENSEIKYNNPHSVGEKSPTFKGFGGKDFSMKFYLDNTGAIRGSNSIDDSIKKLETVSEKYVGKTHETPFLKVVWGTLNFKGRLKKKDVKYTMFSADGEPLRAEVNLLISLYIDVETDEKEKNSSSPDLSHLFTVKSGDTLPQLCKEVYGSIGYVTDVARINGLSGFRHLIPGTKLLFPPLSDKK